MNSRLLTSYSISVQCMGLSCTVSMPETTSGFGEIESTEIPPPFSSQPVPHRFYRCTQTDRRGQPHYYCGHNRHTDAHRQTDMTERITTSDTHRREQTDRRGWTHYYYRNADVIECITNIDTPTWSNALHILILSFCVDDVLILSFYVAGWPHSLIILLLILLHYRWLAV